ncbi:hypothetical protein FF1_009006 [Malus domestica]
MAEFAFPLAAKLIVKLGSIDDEEEQETRERLCELKDDSNFIYLRTVHHFGHHVREHTTLSFVRAWEAIGRDMEKNKIIDLVMHQGGDQGLGKTTKLVYSDQKVLRNFDLTWQDVSLEFDVTELAKDTLSEGLSLDQLQEKLPDA